jgi:hypothetical protein
VRDLTRAAQAAHFEPGPVDHHHHNFHATSKRTGNWKRNNKQQRDQFTGENCAVWHRGCCRPRSDFVLERKQFGRAWVPRLLQPRAWRAIREDDINAGKQRWLQRYQRPGWTNLLLCSYGTELV